MIDGRAQWFRWFVLAVVLTSFAQPGAATDLEVGLARKLIAQNRFQEARAVLAEIAADAATAPAEAFFQLAVCETQLQDWSAAESAIDQALDKEPAYPFAARVKAYILFSTGRYPQALEWTTRHLEQSPDDGVALKIAGLARFMTGDAAGAEQDLAAATERLPEDFNARYYLGRIYFERSKLSPALEAFRRALEIDPRSAKAYNHLGQTLEGLTQFDEAEQAYRKAIELERSTAAASEWPYYNLGALLLSRGDADQAVVALSGALERNPASVKTRIKLGTALSGAGRHDEALVQLRAAVAAEPANADAHYQLGRLLMKLGETDAGRRHLQRFQELQRK